MNLVERVLSERHSGFIHPDLNLIRTEGSRTVVPHVCRGAGKHQTMPKNHDFPCIAAQTGRKFQNSKHVPGYNGPTKFSLGAVGPSLKLEWDRCWHFLCSLETTRWKDKAHIFSQPSFSRFVVYSHLTTLIAHCRIGHTHHGLFYS